MGAIMMYGSYLPEKSSIATTSITISIADTAVALLAGLAIFPIVFAFPALEASAGPGLIFQTLPLAFAQMPGGQFFGTLFFILIVLAAWTSSISLVEPAVAWLVENHGLSRIMAAVSVGLAIWLLGIATILSFSSWAFEFNFMGTVKQNGIFDMLDILTANIMLPLGGLLIAIFAGRCMTRSSSVDEFSMGDGFIYKIWWLLIRYITPVAVVIVFLNAIGVV
jgi:NSS family neurotransmitter:Na+ symporter